MDNETQKSIVELLDELAKDNPECEDNLDEIQQHYEELIYNYSDKLFIKLCNLIERKITRWVGNTLRTVRIFDETQKEDAFQEGRNGLSKALKKDIRTGCVKDTYVKYAIKVYKNNTFNVIRKRYGRNGQNEGTVNAQSLDSPVTEEGATLLDLISVESPDSAVLSEKRQLYHAVFTEYCRAILNLDDFALKSIALLYARVFPHMLSDISDSKQASAKQGHIYMKNRSVWELKELAELILHKMVDRGLVWGDAFLKQMEEPSSYDPDKPLKDLIYTEVISQKQTSHWADAVHKNATKAAFRAIRDNEELYKRLKGYLDKGDLLYGLLDGGNKK